MDAVPVIVDNRAKSEIKMLKSVTKKVHVKSRGKVMGVVREQYLRNDIPCQSDLCFEDSCPKKQSGNPTLSKDVTHYLLPMEDVAKHFFDVLENEFIRGVIFTQTVVNAVNNSSLRHYRRLCSLIRDPKKQSIFFPNEFSANTHCGRKSGENLDEWKARMAFKAANWYYDHLGGQKPLVIVTEDENVVGKYQHERVEIFVLSLDQYLLDFWGSKNELREMYEGLAAARLVVKDSDLDYTDYLRQEALEAGIKKGKFISGRLNVDKYRANQEAFVVRSLGSQEMKGVVRDDVLVPGMVMRNRAVHGDAVVVQLLPKSEWKSKMNRLTNVENKKKDDSEDAAEKEDKWERRADVCPTGKVVGILQRNWREYIATIPKTEAKSFQRSGSKRLLACPYDYRIPKIRILTSQAEKLSTERFVVRIDNWPVNSQYPNGHFVRALGKIGDVETEIDGILAENEISITPFSQGMLAEMPSNDWEPDPEEVKKRQDLRQSHVVMSIDPQGCEDVDDTLSVRRLKNGNLELGVHIADVTHFVPFNSLADLEARRRATTVYLADRRYDMLPSVLSANVCSLLGGVDRYAVSVLWELDPKTYDVISVWYGRTVIKSAYKMCYEAAQDVINGKSAEEMRESIPELSGFGGQGLQKKFKQLKDILSLLSNIAQKIQDNREKEGALTLESTEVRLEFNAASVDDIKPKEHLKIHETVAECMIFANHWVAKKIAKSFPHQALLRRHPPPRKEAFEELKNVASSRGWRIEVWCNRVLADSLNSAVDKDDPSVNFLLRSLATYAMVQAVYFSTGSANTDEWEHYGLALKQYTHFTSPIRRYADVIVHRLLLAAVEKADWFEKDDLEKKPELMSNHDLQELSQHINERNKAAQQAQRASQSLFQTLFFKGKEPDDPRCIVEAVIFSIRPNGFLVYVPRYALKGPVILQNKENEALWWDKKLGPLWVKNGVVWAEDHVTHVETDRGRQSYRIFDHVTVTIQMVGSDVHPCTLKYYLLAKKRPSKVDKIDLEQGEMNFLQEIRKEQTEEEIVNEEMMDWETKYDLEEGEAEHNSKKKSKKTKNDKSMFEFFQDLKVMGVSEVNDK